MTGKYLKKLVSSVLILTLPLLSGCEFKFPRTENETSKENEKPSNAKVARFIPKEVEVFDLNQDNSKLEFTRSGTVTSEKTVQVSPEVSGKITSLNIKVGDTVKNGDIIAELGDSLSITTLDIQEQNARNNLNLIKQSKDITQQISQLNLESSGIASENAQKNFSSGLEQKANSNELLQEQEQSLILSIKNAEEALENAEDNYDRALDALDDAEENLEDYEDDVDDRDIPEDPTIESQLETAIEQAEAQVDSAKFAKESAEIGLKQAKNALAQFYQTEANQISQIDQGLNNSETQVESSRNQESITALSGIQQDLNLDTQITQAETQLEIAELNSQKKLVKSPTSGTITEILIEEDNFANQGQAIVTIEDIGNGIIKTNVSSDERDFINLGDEVKISTTLKEANGFISEISPKVNTQTKKFDVEISIDSGSSFTPGTITNITFSKKPTNRLFIPLSTISLIENTKNVKIVSAKNQKVFFRPIKTGLVVGQFIEVLEGLEGNEKIIKNQEIFINEREVVEIINS